MSATGDDGEGFLRNRNVEWMDSRFWVFYTVLYFAARFTLMMVPIVKQELAWTTVHIIAAVVTYFCFHWLKGSPYTADDEDGEYNSLTFWEQIDHGVQYTPNRKFLTIFPVIIYILACYDVLWDPTWTYINTLFLLVCIVPKAGFSHRLRVAGINAD